MDRDVHVLGVPMDLGADRRGVDMGPSAIRYAGLAGQVESTGVDCSDAGDLPVPRAEERDPTAAQPEPGTARYIREVEEVCRDLSGTVAGAIDEGRFPLILGGDHSIAIGTVGGSARDEEIGVLWFDAHGDCNTPATSPSGNVHGMPLAAILGKGTFGEMDWAHAPNVREENVAMVGLRSVDEDERATIRESDVAAYTMTDVDERGVTEVLADALDDASHGVDGLHVSLDLDWLDPHEAPGVGTPVRGGVTYREAHAALELVARRDAAEGILRSMDLVEVNPILDRHNETAELATELAASVLGKRIL